MRTIRAADTQTGMPVDESDEPFAPKSVAVIFGTSVAPFSESFRAIASPMPPEAPVTIAIESSNSTSGGITAT